MKKVITLALAAVLTLGLVTLPKAEITSEQAHDKIVLDRTKEKQSKEQKNNEELKGKLAAIKAAKDTYDKAAEAVKNAKAKPDDIAKNKLKELENAQTEAETALTSLKGLNDTAITVAGVKDTIEKLEAAIKDSDKALYKLDNSIRGLEQKLADSEKKEEPKEEPKVEPSKEDQTPAPAPQEDTTKKELEQAKKDLAEAQKALEQAKKDGKFNFESGIVDLVIKDGDSVVLAVAPGAYTVEALIRLANLDPADYAVEKDQKDPVVVKALNDGSNTVVVIHLVKKYQVKVVAKTVDGLYLGEYQVLSLVKAAHGMVAPKDVAPKALTFDNEKLVPGVDGYFVLLDNEFNKTPQSFNSFTKGGNGYIVAQYGVAKDATAEDAAKAAKLEKTTKAGQVAKTGEVATVATGLGALMTLAGVVLATKRH